MKRKAPSKPLPPIQTKGVVFVRLAVSGDQASQTWSSIFCLRPSRLRPQLWLVGLPSPCANPGALIRRLAANLYELQVRLSGPTQPASFTNCNQAQRRQWAEEPGQRSLAHPTTVAVFAGAGNIRVTIR